jgi:hypothetical protein
MASIPQLIGKINPKLYAENGSELLKKYKTIEKIPADEVKPKNLAEHHLMYDSAVETLEPLYFFILDTMNNYGLSPEKLVDNFTSTPGSGHFSELQGKATAMQQQASKLLADTNTVLRSILNLTHDLKEFKIRLQTYDDLKVEDKKEVAILTLKQIWIDKVDISKGNSSIKGLAIGQAGFQTLIDAFMVAKDEKDVDKINLNDQVKRILKPRIQEFNIWVRESERELTKRYKLEKTYLRSQVNSLKLYSRWAKPYLRAARDLEMSQKNREPALVKVFNTLMLELTLLGKQKINIKEAALEGEIPEDLEKLKTKRDYFSCILIDFSFRGIPQRTQRQQGEYAFGGRADVKFIAYALNSEELKMLDKELDKSDIEDVLRLIEGATTDSLDQMQKDINYFLDEDEEEKKKNRLKKEGNNPFMALIGSYNKEEPETKKENKEKKKEDDKIKPDNWIEKTHIRTFAANKAEYVAFDLFDIYKKAHGMPSFT